MLPLRYLLGIPFEGLTVTVDNALSPELPASFERRRNQHLKKQRSFSMNSIGSDRWRSAPAIEPVDAVKRNVESSPPRKMESLSRSCHSKKTGCNDKKPPRRTRSMDDTFHECMLSSCPSPPTRPTPRPSPTPEHPKTIDKEVKSMSRPVRMPVRQTSTKSLSIDNVSNRAAPADDALPFDKINKGNGRRRLVRMPVRQPSQTSLNGEKGRNSAISTRQTSEDVECTMNRKRPVRRPVRQASQTSLCGEKGRKVSVSMRPPSENGEFTTSPKPPVRKPDRQASQTSLDSDNDVNLAVSISNAFPAEKIESMINQKRNACHGAIRLPVRQMSNRSLRITHPLIAETERHMSTANLLMKALQEVDGKHNC